MSLEGLTNEIFFEQHPDPMWIFDRASFKFLRVNEAAVQHYGYSREEFLNLTIADIKPAGEIAEMREIVAMPASDVSDARTLRHKLKSGQLIFVNIRMRDLEFDNKSARLVIARDVSAIIEGSLERLALISRERDTANRLADTIESLSDGFAMLDPDLNFIFMNRAAEKILGADRSTLIGRSLLDAYPVAAERTFEREFRRTLASGEVARFTDYYPPMEKWYAVEAHPTSDGLAIYFRDVTQQRLQGGHLRLLEKAIEHLNDVLIITQAEPINAPEGPLVVYANNAFPQRTGYTLEEVLGKTPRMLQGPKTQRDRLDAMRESMEAWEPHRTELINYTKSGEEMWVEIEIVPFADDTGYFTHWVSVQRDITDRIHAEEVERLSNERFATVAKAVEDVVWEWDLVTNAVWWSDVMQTRFGHPRIAVEETVDFLRDGIHPEDRQRVISKFESLMARNESKWEDEYRTSRADGSYAVVINRAFVVRDDSGTPVRMIGTMVDITEKRELDARLVQAQKLEALGQLTGGIAHDFNNLLTVIVGNSEILTQQLPAKTDAHTLAELTLAAGQRGAELTNRLLAFGKRQPLEARLVDVGQLVQSLAPLLRRTLPENIQLEVMSLCDPCLARVDPGQLESALLNLVINARDAMPEGGSLAVRTDIEGMDSEFGGEDPATGRYLKLSVEDTGSGMSDDTVSHAFEPFFTTKDVGEGSGLGLSMVYGFVKQSSGRVTISTTLGTGTEVAMYFPVADSPTDCEIREPQQETWVGGDEKILVVEDDDMVRTHVTSQLTSLGYTIVSANDGKVALEMLKQHIDTKLIFTDIVMPGGIDGVQLASKARNMRPRLKVLFTSGYTGDGAISKAIVGQQSQLLYKPYRLKDLAQKVRAAIDSRPIK